MHSQKYITVIIVKITGYKTRKYEDTKIPSHSRIKDIMDVLFIEKRPVRKYECTECL
jgi:hypothetical protein